MNLFNKLQLLIKALKVVIVAFIHSPTNGNQNLLHEEPLSLPAQAYLQPTLFFQWL